MQAICGLWGKDHVFLSIHENSYQFKEQALWNDDYLWALMGTKFQHFCDCQTIKKIQLAMQWMLVNRMGILVQQKLRIFKSAIMKTTE